MSSYLVYLPPGYDEARNMTRRYPVIYWLHGYGAGPQHGVVGFVHALDEAIRHGRAPPMIAVLPNGLVDSWYCDAADGSQPVESVIMNDLIPHVDSTLRTIARREGRAIEGFSMGAWGAAHLAFKYPDRFAAVTIVSTPLVSSTQWAQEDPEEFRRIFGASEDRFLAEEPAALAHRNRASISGSLRIRILIGSRDPNLFSDRGLHESFTRDGVVHDFTEVSEVEHRSTMYYDALSDGAFEFYANAFRSLGEQRER